MSTVTPKFDLATAKTFVRALYDNGPAALVVGDRPTQGMLVQPDNLVTVLAGVQGTNVWFHCQDLTPEWANPASHAKGKVTTADKSHVLGSGFLWLDCDCAKYEGNDASEAEAHYMREGVRVLMAIDEGLTALGLKAFAKWRSGAGWQALIKLDAPIPPADAEELVGKLHKAIGKFEPVVRNANRLLRLPGSVNYKNGKDGRVPAPCGPCYIDGHIMSVEAVSAALANVAAPAGAPSTKVEIKIDWSLVEQHAGWLKSAADLADDFPRKGHIIVDHTGNLKELNADLVEAGLTANYTSWSEVTAALAATFKGYGKYSLEQIAAALQCPLKCNEHVTKQKDQRRPVERALKNLGNNLQRPTALAGAPQWRDFRDKDCIFPKVSLRNTVIAITALGIECHYDLFHNRILIAYQGEQIQIQNLVGEFTDTTLGAIRSLIDKTYVFDPGDHVFAAVCEIANDNASDPVLNYVAECQTKWDGKPRIDTWLTDYCGAEDTPLTRAIGSLSLIGSVDRARNPGCKLDEITVLESAEGFDKSTGIEVLYGKENFSDQTILGRNDREVQEQVEGVWGYEIADLTGITRAEVDQVKAFCSRNTDRVRPAYGRVRVDRPRRCKFWATTNNKEYLLSQTGNRRFWPVVVGRIDIKRLREDRDLLWGEAAHRQAAGESSRLDPKLWEAAAEQQEQRRQVDPWENVLAYLPETIMWGQGSEGAPAASRQIIWKMSGEERVSTGTLLTHVLKIPVDRQHSSHGTRLTNVMLRLGWQQHDSRKVWINNQSVAGFWRPDYSRADVQEQLAIEYVEAAQ